MAGQKQADKSGQIDVRATVYDYYNCSRSLTRTKKQPAAITPMSATVASAACVKQSLFE